MDGALDTLWQFGHYHCPNLVAPKARLTAHVRTGHCFAKTLTMRVGVVLSKFRFVLGLKQHTYHKVACK